MPILTLAIKSLWSRRGTALLTIGSLAVSVMLLLGVEKVKREARNSFTSTISGTDLIVGARSGGVQLLLYSVFRIGNAANNISIDSYSRIAAFPETAWTIPLSLGDSHRGFRVLGTTVDYFTHYRYARKWSLSFRAGKQFEDIFDAVLGAEVAETLGYQIGDPIVVNHGIGAVGFAFGAVQVTQRPEDTNWRIALARLRLEITSRIMSATRDGIGPIAAAIVAG